MSQFVHIVFTLVLGGACFIIFIPSAHSVYIDVNGDRRAQFLTHLDSPYCTIRFRRESHFHYFELHSVEPNVFVVPFDAWEPNNPFDSKWDPDHLDNNPFHPYQGDDHKYLAEIFQPVGRIPPYVILECVATYATKFRFDGVGALQFLRITQAREQQILVSNADDNGGGHVGVDSRSDETNSTRIVYRIEVQALLSPNATGEYIIYPAEDDSQPLPLPLETTDTAAPDPPASGASSSPRQTSFYIFSEGRSPYLLGRGRTVQGFANDATVIVPCICSKYDQVVKLFWKNNKTNSYQFTADSNNNIHGIKYVRTIGFIVSRRELRQSTKYPLVPGEYRCMTDSANDFVDVLVNTSSSSTQPSPSSDTARALRVQVERNGATIKALCTGPPDSNVMLTRFQTRSHLEGQALSKCLADIGTPCGHLHHERMNGYNLGRYSALTGLGPSGFLVCTSDTGDLVYTYYFTGLDEEIYTQPWREIPIPAQLRLKINRRVQSFDFIKPLQVGEPAKIYCDTVGDFNQPRFIYVTFANGSRTFLGSVDDDHPLVIDSIRSTWRQFTCDAGPWDYSGSIYMTQTVDAIQAECSSNSTDYFQCADEKCISKLSFCFERGRECNDDGSESDFNCSAFYPNCSGSGNPNVNYWPCHNGRCIREADRCDGHEDCVDDSDEDIDQCSRDFAPVILEGSREFTVLKYQELNIVCEVAINRAKDELHFKWFLIEEKNRMQVKSEYEQNGTITILQIPNVTEANTYICTATNKFGSVSATYDVYVYDPSPPPTTTTSTTTSATTTTTEEATPPPRPQRPPVSHRFRCEAEGKHPDPVDCRKYHECVPSGFANSQYIQYDFSCGAGTVYCEQSQTCGYERDCPCENGKRY